MGSSMGISQPEIQLKVLSLLNKQMLLRAYVYCARSLRHFSEQTGTDLCPHGTYILVWKVVL